MICFWTEKLKLIELSWRYLITLKFYFLRFDFCFVVGSVNYSLFKERYFAIFNSKVQMAQKIMNFDFNKIYFSELPENFSKRG